MDITARRRKPRPALPAVPPAPKLSPQEQWQQDFDQWEPRLVRSLEWQLESAAKSRAEFIAKIQKPGDLARAVEWGAPAVQADQEAVIIAEVLAHRAEEPGEGSEFAATSRGRLINALRYWHKRCTDELIHDRLPGNSTGHFHRAEEASKRAAYAAIRERFERSIDSFDQIEQDGRALGGC